MSYPPSFPRPSSGCNLKPQDPSDCDDGSLLKTKTGKTKEEPRKELISKVLHDGTIVETIFNDTREPRCRFIVAEPNKPPVEADQITVGETVFFPPARQEKLFEDGIVKLASGLENYGTVSDLFEEVRAFIASYVDLEPFNIKLAAHYSILSWVFDGFRAWPYLGFRGQPGTGKTRSLQVVSSICYRSVDLGNTNSGSALMRYADMFRSALTIDESDFSGDLRDGFFKTLNAGYYMNGGSSLSVKVGKDWEPRSFKVYGPKLVGNRLEWPDAATESRIFTIMMVSKPLADHVPAELPYRFEAEAQSLRNKLLQYRLDNLHHITKQHAALKGMDGRAQQLGLPIFSISPDPVFRAEFLRYLKRRSQQLREHDPLVVTLEAILRVHNSRNENVGLARIREEARNLARERDVADYEFTSRRTAELVRSLRFKTAKRESGLVVFIDQANLQAQAERFGLNNRPSRPRTADDPDDLTQN